MVKRGRGHGKLILFGEHCCVYGYPAITLGLNFFLELEWRSDGEAGIGVRIDVEGSEDGDAFLQLLDLARNCKNSVPLGGEWYCRSSVPRVGGFGSSGAFCVALARLLLSSFELEYNKKIHVLANYLEGIFHGNPSGIDTGAALSEGIYVWRGFPGKQVDSLPIRHQIEIPRLHMIYGALPREGGTAESVGRLRTLWNEGDDCVHSAMDELGSITDDFIHGDADDFSLHAGELMNRSQAVLRKLGLSNDNLDFIFETAISMGASGGKLSGGGMGGAFIICCRDECSRKRLIAALSDILQSEGVILAHPISIIDIG